MYVVYILKCGGGTLYTGITTDIAARIAQHRAGTGAKYTRGRGPFTLAYTERHPNRSSATKREQQIKRQNRAHKLQLIRGSSSAG
ncbi:MAG: GIY-YIG nuclease family protein [Candidatus Yanofskybacteria bacterium]|nr:GIY-YIG nuclease family protein [Candidatus Yanofskybacteria bacterium]